MGKFGFLTLGVIATTLFISLLLPWPHFKWAAHKNTISGYERYLRTFPSSHHEKDVQGRITALMEPDVWANAQKSDRIEAYRGYVRTYPTNRNAVEARARIVELADAKWNEISKSRSEDEIRKFVNKNPETTKLAEAEARVKDLYSDLEWIREQDTLRHFQSFAARFPNHEEIDSVEKRIIDLEVKKSRQESMEKCRPLSP